MTKPFSFPLIDLHCHLDGSISLSTMEKLLGRPVSPEEVEAPKDCTSLNQYLDCFALPLALIKNEHNLKIIAKDFLLDSASQGLSYVETRFAPMSCVTETLDAETAIRAVLSGLEEAYAECQLPWNLILCAMRNDSEETNRELIRVGKQFLGKGVCAFDIAGAEALYPGNLYFSLLEEARANGFALTLHAGECGNAQNVADAVRSGALRIGHGIAMKDTPMLMELCAKKQICVEMCPISNHQTHAVLPGEHYPLKDFLKAGIPVTLNTDNRTVSGTTLKKEIAFVTEHFGVTEEELKTMAKNAVLHSFASPDQKEKLLEQF